MSKEITAGEIRKFIEGKFPEFPEFRESKVSKALECLATAYVTGTLDVWGSKPINNEVWVKAAEAAVLQFNLCNGKEVLLGIPEYGLDDGVRYLINADKGFASALSWNAAYGI